MRGFPFRIAGEEARRAAEGTRRRQQAVVFLHGRPPLTSGTIVTTARAPAHSVF